MKKAPGGSMKPVPKGNKGLAKLPTKVRNRMGYAKGGGKLKMVEKDGKKVPFFAADGVGKMVRGGSLKMKPMTTKKRKPAPKKAAKKANPKSKKEKSLFGAETESSVPLGVSMEKFLRSLEKSDPVKFRGASKIADMVFKKKGGTVRNR